MNQILETFLGSMIGGSRTTLTEPVHLIHLKDLTLEIDHFLTFRQHVLSSLVLLFRQFLRHFILDIELTVVALNIYPFLNTIAFLMLQVNLIQDQHLI